MPENGHILDLTQVAWQEHLLNMATTIKPELIIIDSLTSISSAGQNSVEDTNRLLMFLVGIARELDCGLLVLHHLRKPGSSQLSLPGMSLHDFRGSSHITAMARTVLGLNIIQNGRQFSLKGPRRLDLVKTNLGNYPEGIGIELQREGDKVRFVYGAAPGFDQDSPGENCEQWIVTYLHKAIEQHTERLRIEAALAQNQTGDAAQQAQIDLLLDAVGDLQDRMDKLERHITIVDRSGSRTVAFTDETDAALRKWLRDTIFGGGSTPVGVHARNGQIASAMPFGVGGCPPLPPTPVVGHQGSLPPNRAGQGVEGEQDGRRHFYHHSAAGLCRRRRRGLCHCSWGWLYRMVTHSINEAVFLADRVIVLSEPPGRIVAQILVDFPRLRGTTLLSTATFGELTAEVRAAIGGDKWTALRRLMDLLVRPGATKTAGETEFRTETRFRRLLLSKLLLPDEAKTG